MLIANNHNYILLFTELGRCFWMRAYEVPEATKTSQGRVIQNLINIPKEDSVKGYIIIKDLTDKEFQQNNFIFFATRKGMVKKTSVEAFSRPRTNGINAITINEGDELIEVRLTDGNSEILIANRNGRAIRFEESKVRAMGRSAAGVRGITLDDDGDHVVGAIVRTKDIWDNNVFVISENGLGKRSDVEEYRQTNRGGKGVRTLNVTERTGKLAAIKSVNDMDDLLITTKDGIMIRSSVADMRIMGRATQGVKVINLKGNDRIADVVVIRKSEDEVENHESSSEISEEE